MNARFGWFRVGVLAAAALGLASTAMAQGGETPAPLAWQDMWRFGGSLMYVLAVMSIGTLALVLYFFAVLRPGQVAPPPLLRALRDSIRRGDLEDARRTSEGRPCPLAAVALAALDHLRDGAAPDAPLLRDIMEGEGSRQAEAIQGQTQYLMDIAVIAPMVGLLGTVFGMLQAFSTIATDIARAKPLLLAAGVSQALVTTAFGLIVGIPAMAFYAYFRRRASRMVSHLESASAELMTALSRTPGR